MGELYTGVTGKVERIIFYNPQSNWGVFKITNNLENDKIFKEPDILIAGNYEGVFEDCIVEVNGEHKYHPKYGDQLAISFLKVKKEYSNKESIVNFLSKSTIKGISIQNALKIFKKFGEESINVVLNQTEKILDINGIGLKTVVKVKSSVEKYKNMEALIEYCIPLGFTYNIISKLDNALGEEAVDILKENIYSVLDHTDAVTFKQLDTVALNNGTSPEDKNRLKYGFLYTLKNRVMFEGSTGCGMQNIKDEIFKELGIKDINLFYSALNNLEIENKLYLDNSKIFYKEFYDIEKSIADKIISLVENNIPIKIDENILKEEINNFPFTLNTQQIEAIRNSLDNNISIITGAGGCVDEETEFLSLNGWKKIKEYNKNEEIAVYNKDTKGIAFEIPSQFHEYPATDWYEFKNNTSLDQKLSGEHRVPYISDRKGNFLTKYMEDIYNISKKHTRFRGKFITSFYTDSEKKLCYTDNYLRLVIAVFLKGSIKPVNKINRFSENISCKVRAKKEEEQIKIEQLLKEFNIEFNYSTTVDYSNYYKSSTIYNFDLIKNFPNFPESFYSLNQKQLKVIYEEICFWGKNSRKNIIFTTTSKKLADFIQFVVTTLGYRSNIKKEGKRYIITKCDHTLVGLEKNRGDRGVITPIKKSEAKKEEYKYCFTTSSSYWVARRNDKIFITGNSGKTSILKALSNIFSRGGFNVELLSPTGKASRRIEECTGRYAQTIHKYIINLENSNEEKIPRKTIILIDESSMLDIIIFNRLLDFINVDTRIILIGDTNQLPSVQAGNVLEDLMTCNRVSVNVLTDVMRQSKNSSIIKYCNKINQGKLVDECDKEDLFYQVYFNRDCLLEQFSLSYDKEVMQNGMDNVQVIMPYKKGDLGVNKLNAMIRAEYNLNPLDERYNYKLDDKIMHIKNNYGKGIFNGEVGRVSAINVEEDFLEVTYDNGKIKYEIDDIDETILAYTMTCHKSQGSEYPIVFVILDDENPLLLSRKILYTACSRAKKKLYLLTMNNSVEKCILNNYFKPRITALNKFLSSSLTKDKK